MRREVHDELVLSLVPTARGLSYTLFSAPLSPIDWGAIRFRGKEKNAASLALIDRLCRAQRPQTIIIEDCTSASCRRRSPRILRLFQLIAAYAETENVTLERYSRAQMKGTFGDAGAFTRYEIAQAIASYIPALSEKLPPVRRLWKSEDPRLSLFDAAALALTHYAAVTEQDEPP